MHLTSLWLQGQLHPSIARCVLQEPTLQQQVSHLARVCTTKVGNTGKCVVYLGQEIHALLHLAAGAATASNCTLCLAGTYSTAAGGYGLHYCVLDLMGREEAAWQARVANHLPYSG